MLLILAACGGAPPDPELVRAAEALAQWRRGREALDTGRAEEAASAFAAARSGRRDPILAAWEAEASAAAGDPVRAESLYRDALGADPSIAAARWALALLLARRGALGEASGELRRAIADGAGAAVDVRVDPEWAPFLGDPSFAWVPAATVGLSLAGGLPETTYWGSELTVSLVAEGRLGPTAAFRAGAEGPVSLVSVSERIEEERRLVDLVWRVVGPGPIRVGPFAVTTAGVTAEAAGASTVAAAPPGREAPRGGPGFAVTTGDALPEGIARVDGTVWVPLGPADRVETEPPRPQVRVIQRRGDTVRAWIGLADTPPGTPMRVGRGRSLRDEVAP